MKLLSPLNLFKKWIFSQTCCNNYRIIRFQLLYLKRENSTYEIFKNRLNTILRIIKTPLYLSRKKVNTSYIIYGNKSGKKIMSYIINRYDSKDDVFLMTSFVNDPIFIYTITDFFRFIKYYFIAIKDAFFLLFIFNRISTKELFYFLHLKIRLLLYKPKKLYIWPPKSPESQLVFLFFKHCMNGEVDIITGPHIKLGLRYGYYENLKLCYLSKISKQEFLTLEKIGWIESKNVKHQIIGIYQNKEENIKNNSFLYDIGFYSSGYWARDSFGLRSYSADEIQNNKNNYCKNPNAKIEKIVLSNLIKLIKKYNLSLKIYLHPYEQECIEKFNIYPPYWDLLTIENNITIPKKNIGVNNIYETKIAVVIASTIFYDRWGNNLFTLCFNPKNKQRFGHIQLKYLGKYKKYGFQNLKELEEKILNELKKDISTNEMILHTSKIKLKGSSN